MISDSADKKGGAYGIERTQEVDYEALLTQLLAKAFFEQMCDRQTTLTICSSSS